MQTNLVKKVSAISATLVLSFVVFQNCSPAKFSSPSESTKVSQLQVINPADLPDPGTGNPDPTPTPGRPTGNPGASPTPPPGATPKPKEMPEPKRTPKPDETSDDPSGGSDLVECEVNGSSHKVVSSGGIILNHSNSSATRLCMSENACNNLIKAYVSLHSCELVSGPANSPASTQCNVGVFPGSKGTCKHADVISDADLAALLIQMGQ